jgi:hypothetical protein
MNRKVLKWIPIMKTIIAQVLKKFLAHLVPVGFKASEFFIVQSCPSPSAEWRAVPASHWPTGRPAATADWPTGRPVAPADYWPAGRYGPGSPPPWISWRPTGASCARQGQPGCDSWPPLLPLRPPRGSHRRPLLPPLRCSRRRGKRSCLQYTYEVSSRLFRNA